MKYLNLLPTKSDLIENSVSLGTLENIAESHAHSIWGKNVARGNPIPLANEEGKTIAYVFPYIRNSKQFPEYENIFNKIRDLQHRSHNQSHDNQKGMEEKKVSTEFYYNLEQEVGQFGSIYVSAIRDDFPIIGVTYSLHPYFTVGELAQEKAESYFKQLDSTKEIKLEKIYFLDALDEFFSFSDGDRNILINARSMEIKLPKEALVRRQKEPLSDHIRSEIEKAWSHAEGKEPFGINSEKYTMNFINIFAQIPNWELIPIVNWTWWCVPTASAMVVGYWDNYVKGKGTILGYGRLISHWFDHPKFANNVPSYIDELIDPTTKTWRAGFKDFPDFILKTYGYNFAHKSFDNASANNDWFWNVVVGEVAAGRPFIWAMSDPNHSMAGFGYRINNAGKFVVAYNTWGDSEQQQRSEWIYTKCSGLAQIVPGGGTNGEHLVIDSPDGGEVMYTQVPTDISWFVWGSKIQKTAISFSQDGGNTWLNIESDLKTQPGWNFYSWRPNNPTSKGRVRVKGYSSNNDYIAGDGSHTNFKILPGQLLNISGKIKYLRLHDLKTGYGPQNDYLDVEVVLRLDSNPNTALGFQLRNASFLPAHKDMLSLLIDAFDRDRTVSLDYIKTGLNSGVVIRTWLS